MKQHITSEQLKELSEKEQEKLRQYWHKTGRKEGYLYGDYEQTLPILNIGQMIEYLVSKTATKNRLYLGWLTDKDYIINTENLCDDLWKRVKENLAAKSLIEMQQEKKS